jgi:uncharacterized protein (DUF433 family)
VSKQLAVVSPVAPSVILKVALPERITKLPDICGGRASIAGHRVRVLDVVIWHEQNALSPDEIVSQVPSITLADVHAALACYYDHREEIQEEIRAEWAQAEGFHRNNPSALTERLSQGENARAFAFIHFLGSFCSSVG